MTEQVFITGGTGFIGKALVDALMARGDEVTVFTRDVAKAASLFPEQVRCTDSMTPGRYSIIINLAGETIAQYWTQRAQQRIRDSRIETTSRLVQMMQQMETKPRLFISGSAIGYYGTHPSMQFNETNTPTEDCQKHFATKLCVDWEAEAQKAASLDIRTVMLRTGVVLEKDGGTLAKLLLPFKLGLGGKIGSGEQWFSWIARDDLIRMILRIIDDESIVGPVNATAPNPVTNVQFTKAMGRAFGRPTFFAVPSFVMKTLFGQMADEILLHGQKVLPEKILECGFRFESGDLDKALKAILG